MKIGIIGYGKMGKTIERIANERGHEIVYRINSSNPIEQVDLNQADVAIEFTRPELAVSHIDICLNAQVPVVVGTTAWQNDLPQVLKAVEEKNGSLLYASNFSLGVNIFFHMNEKLAKIMSNQSEYSAEVSEIHHVQKLDAPSGTAVSIAQGILENNSNYTSYVSELGKTPTHTAQELPITAYREPEVPGTHTVTYNSEIDLISMTHIAHNRDGFALGSVVAAEFLHNKKGVFTMRDVLEF
ncbi:MAG: 4-hydroxy-tetrahydrodipicolinate reductase [Fluviicola sp.]|jgi:4-hydroxy-tetrahydrodipicolinate reductase